jgi:hypothetical protein
VSTSFWRQQVADNTPVKTLSGPRRHGPTYLCQAMIAITIGSSAAVFFGIGTAYPHDPNRPELGAWFRSLKNKAGKPCCDGADAEHAEAEWDMVKRGYRVLLKNPLRPDEPAQWYDIPYSVVIERPNLSGIAMVWWWPSYEMDDTMTPQWRCFIPGAGG